MQIGIAIGTAVGIVATAVGVAMRLVKRSRRSEPPSEPPPPQREPTGRHRTMSAEFARDDFGTKADVALIREIVVELRQSAAESAGDRAREYVNRENVARMAELVEQLYTAHERRAGDAERALRAIQRTLNEVLEELRRRNRDAFEKERV